MKQVNFTGQRIGRWTVISQAASRHGVTRWYCRCKCGTERIVSRTVLADKINKVKSCGCWRRDRITAANTKHGKSRTPTWCSWSSMMTRCYNSKIREFNTYGGRGIKVCERWHKFENFLADMGERPEGKTLDRFPNFNGDYEPGNCRWATPKEQRHNQRPRYSPEVLRKILDTSKTVYQVADELGLHDSTVYRLRKLARAQVAA